MLRAALTLVAAFVLGLSAAPARAGELVWIDVLGTSDLHGHVLPRTDLLTLEDGREVPVERGGLARLAGYVRNVRRANPGRVLLVDSGDMMQGELVSNLGEGRAMVRAMNAMGYAAAAVGNHEFDFGPVGPHATPEPGEDPRGNLKARAAEALFPWLSANLEVDGGAPLAEAVRPYALVAVDGVKVGIVGGVDEDLPQTTIKPNLVGLKVKPLPESVGEAAARARAAGATVVVAIVHAGGECGRTPRRTEQVPGTLESCDPRGGAFVLARRLRALEREGRAGHVDAILGGHTHQGVTAVVEGIPIAQAWSNGLHLARISLEVDREGGRPTGRFVVHAPVEICDRVTELGSCDPRRARGRALRPAEYHGPVEPDAEVISAVAEDVERARAERARALGVTLETPLLRSFKKESPLGNLVADALRAATGADFGVTNGGGLRADLPAGPLTYGALFETLPFDNRLAIVHVDGATIERLLRWNLESDKGVLSISGLNVKARCEAGRVALELTTAGGQALEPARRYRVATSDFLALGGDDFARVHGGFYQVEIDNARPTLRDVVAQALAGFGSLRADDPRIFDKARPRLGLPSDRPVRCRGAAAAPLP